jgi:hypothetical protein
MHLREDDRVSSLEIRGVTKDGNLPAPGSSMTYKFQKRIGIAYDHDAHGYAIIHTARELLGGPWYEHKCVINESKESGLYYGAYNVVSVKTTIVDTYQLS